MSEHTPGPWTAVPCSHGGLILIRGNRVRGDHPQTHLQIVPEADARLIAAAPDLLAALERLYSETADYITINHLGRVHHNVAMQMARDALVKAGSSGMGQAAAHDDARLTEALGHARWIAEREDYTFAECALAEEIVSRANRIVALLGNAPASVEPGETAS